MLAEYFLQLQEHIRQGKPTAEGKHRYIDTAEFWREQYSKLYSEKKAMEVRLARLEILKNQESTTIVIEPYSSIVSIDTQPGPLLDELDSTGSKHPKVMIKERT
jgi:hypothetical protein